MTLLWALWIISGGDVHNGKLQQPQIAAYFQSQDECVRVLTAVSKLAPNKTMQCIQGAYSKP